MPSQPAASIEPDTKDWTWVLDQPCPDCGFDAAGVDRESIAAQVRDNAAFWTTALADPRAASRPAPNVWSPVEYACHVRDVNDVFAGRVEQMLTKTNPLFDNWDQDETAEASRYDLQNAADVVPELMATADLAARWYDRVEGGEWGRPGRRSNGSIFTVETLGRYHLHDLVHHLWDVRWMLVP